MSVTRVCRLISRAHHVSCTYILSLQVGKDGRTSFIVVHKADSCSCHPVDRWKRKRLWNMPPRTSGLLPPILQNIFARAAKAQAEVASAPHVRRA